MERVYIEHCGDLIEVGFGETVVGRDVGCALRVDDPGVSRRHLRLVRRGHDMFVEDLDSRNGTFVNGRRIVEPERVRDGDIIVVSTRVLVVCSAALDPASPPTVDRHVDTAVDLAVARAVTIPKSHTTQPIALDPLQLCPRCGGRVSHLDDDCAGCGFSWGSFQAQPGGTMTSCRRHTRSPVTVPIEYASDELELEATSRDLSESGVFVCSHVLDQIGTGCRLTLHLVDGRLVVRGVVRRVVEREGDTGQPVGLGIEFVEIGDLDRAWLRAVVQRPVSTMPSDAHG